MEGSGSSSSQIVTQVSLTIEKLLKDGLHRSKLVVNLMNSPVLALS